MSRHAFLFLALAATALTQTASAQPPSAQVISAQTATPTEFDCFAASPDSAGKNAANDTCWYTLHVHAVRVSDSGTGARAAAISPDQVARWLAKANEVYAVARVRFEFDPTPKRGDWAELSDTDVNNLAADLPGDRGWERGKATGNELASHFPRKVLLLFRHGPDAAPTGGGFSSPVYNFVVMPGFDVTTICGGAQNSFLLAHEMGHYFGLKHTFREFKTKTEAVAALKSSGYKPGTFDGDLLEETPPEPYIQELSCGADATISLNGIPFPLLRWNVMSYYPSERKTLSPTQATIVRSWVKRRFANAMDGVGLFVPDVRRTYQVVSLAGGKALEVEGASKEKWARIRSADWSGAANQNWRIVPLTSTDTGWFQIVSVGTGKCLTVEAGDLGAGARLVQGDWEASPNQKWRFRQDEHEELVIEPRRGGQVLSVRGVGGTARAGGTSRLDGGFVELSADQGATNQRWRLLPAD